MSVARRLAAGERVDVEELLASAVRVAFGDRLGVTLFLVSLAWYGLYWRLGFFSTDQLTFANGLVALADGHLHIGRVVYGPPSGRTPGTHLVDGRVYARNYGVLVPSLVPFTLLRGLAPLADLRVLLVGGWTLTLLGAVAGVGRALGRPRLGRRAGALLAGGAFALGLAVATPLPARWLPLVALQTTTVLAAALTATTLYRLVSRLYCRRVGAFAGLIAALATPIGFWATLPKRHAVTALLVVVAMYALHRSREATSSDRATGYRALAYATVGPAAWVHAGEGLLLLCALALVDLPTARSNRPRRLALIAGVLGLSLVPFLLTNALVSGNPLIPPRLLPAYAPGVAGVPVADAGAATGSGTAGPGTTAGSVGVAAGPVVAAAGALTSAVDRLLRLLAGSYGLAVTDPGRLVDVFVRSGYVPLSPPSQDVAVNLSVLESMPLLAALAGLAGPAVARSRRSVRRLRDRPLAGALAYAKRTSSPEPVAVLDAFAVAYAVGLLGLFLGRLPAHHMLTVRYLHPLYALGVYWLVRTPAVRRAVGSAGRRLAAAAVAGLAVGVPGYVGALVLLGTTLGEGVQLYALVALCVAATVAVASLRAAGGTDDDVRTLAVALGVAAGISAAFLLVSGVVLFATADEFLLPLGRVVHRVAGGVAVGHPL